MKRVEDTKRLEDFEKYRRRFEILGYPIEKSWVKCQYNEIGEVITVIEVNIGNNGILEIPQFVDCVKPGIMQDALKHSKVPHKKLKVIHKRNRIESFHQLFRYLNVEELDLQEFDTTGAKIFSSMFMCNSLLKRLDLQSVNTDKAIRMEEMFEGCKSLEEIKHNFNTHNVRNMQRMFMDTSLEVIDLQKFDMTQLIYADEMCAYGHRLREVIIDNPEQHKLTDFQQVFGYCKLLKCVDLSRLDMQSVRDMTSTFTRCDSLETVIFPDDLQSVEHLTQTFEACPRLRNVDFQRARLDRLVQLYGTFHGCQVLGDIQIDPKYLKNVKDYSKQFQYCNNITQRLIDKLDTSNCKTFSAMFSYQGQKEPIDFSVLDTRNGLDFQMMFESQRFEKGQNFDINISKQKNFVGMFSQCRIYQVHLRDLPLSTDMFFNSMFQYSCIQQIYFDRCDLGSFRFDNTMNLIAECKSLRKIQFTGCRESIKTSFSRSLLSNTVNNKNRFLINTLQGVENGASNVDIQNQVELVINS